MNELEGPKRETKYVTFEQLPQGSEGEDNKGPGQGWNIKPDKLKARGNLALSGLRVKQLNLFSQSDTAKQIFARCQCSVVLGSSQLS